MKVIIMSILCIKYNTITNLNTLLLNAYLPLFFEILYTLNFVIQTKHFFIFTIHTIYSKVLTPISYEKIGAFIMQAGHKQPVYMSYASQFPYYHKPVLKK